MTKNKIFVCFWFCFIEALLVACWA